MKQPENTIPSVPAEESRANRSVLSASFLGVGTGLLTADYLRRVIQTQRRRVNGLSHAG